jgi:serine protease Do
LQVCVAIARLQRRSSDFTAASSSSSTLSPLPAPAVTANALGLIVSDLNEERRTQLRIKGGVLVDGAEGAAARAGIQTGDVLLALDNIDITGSKQFNELAAKLDRSRAHVLLVRRGDSAQFVPIRPQAR